MGSEHADTAADTISGGEKHSAALGECCCHGRNVLWTSRRLVRPIHRAEIRPYSTRPFGTRAPPYTYHTQGPR